MKYERIRIRKHTLCKLFDMESIKNLLESFRKNPISKRRKLIFCLQMNSSVFQEFRKYHFLRTAESQIQHRACPLEKLSMQLTADDKRDRH